MAEVLSTRTLRAQDGPRRLQALSNLAAASVRRLVLTALMHTCAWTGLLGQLKTLRKQQPQTVSPLTTLLQMQTARNLALASRRTCLDC